MDTIGPMYAQEQANKAQQAAQLPETPVVKTVAKPATKTATKTVAKTVAKAPVKTAPKAKAASKK